MECIAEYDQEILRWLRDEADEPTSVFDLNTELNAGPTYVGDIYDKFAKLIDIQSATIGERLGSCGNWCVISPNALIALKSSTVGSFKSAVDNSFGVTKFVGVINDSIKVYCDPYAINTTPVLVGYKGSDIDGPAVFSPYIPLISSGVVIDPTTFEPAVSFLTRYGFLKLEKGQYNETKDYLGLVGFNPGGMIGGRGGTTVTPIFSIIGFSCIIWF